MTTWRTVAAALLGLALITTTAFAVTPPEGMNIRPVHVDTPTLQTYFTSIGQTIDVQADQAPIALWTTSPSNNSTFTFKLETTLGNAVGLYNGGMCASEYELFPAEATAGWFAVTSFDVGAKGRVVVNLFDNMALLRSSTVYTGVNSDAFGFFVHPLGWFHPDNCYHSEDHENGLAQTPQMLVFPATGRGAGSWWLAIQSNSNLNTPTSFSDALVFLESVNITPAVPATWGTIKRMYSR